MIESAISQETAQLVRRDRALLLQGRVNIYTVNNLYKIARRELDQDIDSLDCSGMRECDSAAIGLLLACLRLAQAQDISLRINGIGGQLLSLAGLYEVETLLRAGADQGYVTPV